MPESISKTLFREMLSRTAAFWRYGILGNSVRLDASTLCQLKCVVCPQAKGEMGFLGRGVLEFKNFKSFVNAHPSIHHIELSNYGEIFLNPHLGNIIRYAFEKGVTLTAWNGVNLNMVSEETLETLVRFRFFGMAVSLDGASQETYSIYRRGGDFNRVLENIDRINHYKQLYRSVLPTLQWQFIVCGHNEHELAAARRMAGEKGMDFIPRLNWDDSCSPLRDRELVKRETGWHALSRREYEGTDQWLSSCLACALVWTIPQINWDGRMLGCPVNLWADFGNVFDSGLARCTRSPKYRHFQKVLLGLTAEPGDIPCVHCRKFSALCSLAPHRRKEILGIRGRRHIPLPLLEEIAFSAKLLARAREIVSRNPR
jgi:MoaA/NifB/PqqE/SkfB family radical SAM enzyme